MTTKPPLQKIFQGILHTENESNKTVKVRQYETMGEEKARKQSNIDSATHNQTLNPQRQLHDRHHHVLLNTNTEC
jgi:hypothetical protein